jgi:DNA-binding response OmpR family regulator
VNQVLAVTQDLLWVGKIRAAAGKLGVEVRVPDSKPRITEYLLDEHTKLVLVDLNHPKYDFVETIRLVKGTRWEVRLVCFGHHTDAERLQRARDTGAKDVWPNSELDRRLPDLLRDL